MIDMNSISTKELTAEKTYIHTAIDQINYYTPTETCGGDNLRGKTNSKLNYERI